jgi:acetyl-CoA carboxylase alpha subunit
VKSALLRHLPELEAMSDDQRLTARYERFRRLGEYAEIGDRALAGI